MSTHKWWIAAACKAEDPELFVDDAPSGGSGKAEYTKSAREMQVRRALWFCGQCPVRGECLTEALETRDRATIRGGMTVVARRAMVRRSEIASASASESAGVA